MQIHYSFIDYLFAIRHWFRLQKNRFSMLSHGHMRTVNKFDNCCDSHLVILSVKKKKNKKKERQLRAVTRFPAISPKTLTSQTILTVSIYLCHGRDEILGRSDIFKSATQNDCRVADFFVCLFCFVLQFQQSITTCVFPANYCLASRANSYHHFITLYR